MKEKLTLDPVFLHNIEKQRMDTYYNDDFVFALMEDDEPEKEGYVLGYLTAS